MGTILVVEDDAAVGAILVALLGKNGHEAVHVLSGEAALDIVESRPFDVVLSDVRMPGMDGIALLEKLSARLPGLPVVLLTAHGSVPLAVEAMRAGAADFMVKPFDKDELLFVLQKALARAPHEERHVAPLEGAGIVGTSPAMKEVFDTVRKVAGGTATVLVRGETGTGKELVARALHTNSPRKNEPFVRVHCAALPDTLLESELFGYEKGAFTGATTRKPGRVELAHKGTLFLDEIGDITLAVQVKLLRILQERELERVGGTETIRVDVRFVTATHRDLEAMVARGEFREDLFYRLNVVPVRVPPLRERGDDVEALASHFLTAYAAANGKPTMKLERGALDALRAYPWPGNVRQLQNLMERLVVLADEPVVRATDVERELGARPTADASTLDAHRAGAEKEALLKALARANDNRTLAARLLGVSRRTLYNKLKEHGIE